MGFSGGPSGPKLILVDPPMGGGAYLLYDDGSREHKVYVHGTKQSRYIHVGCTAVDMDALRFILKEIGLESALMTPVSG